MRKLQPRDEWYIFTGIVLLALAIFISYAYPHDARHPELNAWLMGLRNKNTVPCCDGSDALRIEDADWESHGGHYRVRLEGSWVDVPDDAVVTEPNKAGVTLVWPWRVNGRLDHVRCFMPATMS